MSTQNSWTRWHPLNPLLVEEDEIEQFYGEHQDFKSMTSPVLNTGDIIEDNLRNSSIKYNYYECIHCFKHFNEEEAQRHFNAFKHSDKAKLLQGKHPRMHSFSEMEMHEEERKLSRVKVYYEVVRPEEPLPIPKSPERDWTNIGKLPTPQERETHDLKIAQWREDSERTKGKRHQQISVLPNDLTEETGGKGWWYWSPRIWNGERWSPITQIGALKTGTYEVKGKNILVSDNIRILKILAIIAIKTEL